MQGIPVIDIDVASGAGAQPAWLAEQRARAAEDWTRLGLPTTKDEAWRFTNLRALAESTFEALPSVAPDVDIDAIAQPALTGPQIVYIDGRLAGSLSTNDVDAGVTFERLTDLDDAALESLGERYGGLAATAESPFVALNAAQVDDVTVVRVDRNVASGSPLRILHVTTRPVAVYPRTLIDVADGAEVTIVEDFVQSADQASLSCGVTEVYVGANARAFHYTLLREGNSAFNLRSLHVRQERDSHFESHVAMLGGALIRNDVRPVLCGPNCDSILNGIYVGEESRHMDSSMLVQHSAEHCRSNQYYRGIMAGTSHGVFTGRIIVDRGAQKTDAVQSNQNLLLSPTARANTKPQLEIYADDVRCTHGATIGELDADALMYLRCRGLDPASARGLLVYAYACEGLDRMGLEPVREFCTERLLDLLPETRAVADIL